MPLRRLLNLCLFVVAEVTVCAIGTAGVSVWQLWRHPLRVFVTLVTVIVVAFCASLIHDYQLYLQIKRIVNPKIKKDERSSDRKIA